MRFSLGLPAGGAWADGSPVNGADLVEVSRCAEEAGLDAVFVTDHPFPTARWLAGGGHGTLDPVVALAFVAAATTRIRLHTHLLVPVYRNPFVVAKMVSSLDHLSAGRTIIGLGAGYLEGEFAAVGAPFAERGSALDEAIAAMKVAWTGEEVTFSGTGYSAAGNVMRPAPAQTPHPPLWIGGNSHTAIRRAVSSADGWCPMPSPQRSSRFLATPGIEDDGELARRIAVARALEEEVGRTVPLTLCFALEWGAMPAVDFPEPSRALQRCAVLGGLGIEWLTVVLPGGSRTELCDHIARFGEEIAHPAAG